MNLNDIATGVRAVHFAATLMTSGAVFFVVFIAAGFRARLAAIAWVSLSLTVVSGAAWLALTAQTMSQQPLAAVLSQGVIWTVLSQTHFGNDWLVRLVLAG